LWELPPNFFCCPLIVSKAHDFWLFFFLSLEFSRFSQLIDFSSILIENSFDHLFQLFTLWSWLPVRITMYQPVLLYTTEEHGCSLTTFYVRVEQHEPTLLMIKTCNNEVSSVRKTYVNYVKMSDRFLRTESYWILAAILGFELKIKISVKI
jgi:hypothetical protein